MSRVIITGSRGLIGSSLTEYLSEHFTVLEVDLELGHDLTDESFVKDWFGQHEAEYLVNCFALNDHVEPGGQKTDVFNVSLASIDQFLRVNVTALFSVCREFSKNTSASAIVNFASTYALLSPIPTLYSEGEKHIGYSVSKGAVLQLTRHLAVHLAPRIRVNCVAPGGVEHHEQDKEFQRKYRERTPMGRMMRKEELNGMIKYLCSNESSYMTGSVINLDGGWTTW